MHQAGQRRNDTSKIGDGYTSPRWLVHVGDIFDDSGCFFLLICLPSDGHSMLQPICWTDSHNPLSFHVILVAGLGSLG